MSGWNTIRLIRRLETQADKLGMKFAAYKYDNEFGANVALIPKDNDALPIYTIVFGHVGRCPKLDAGC
jgi:hypothetical protein